MDERVKNVVSLMLDALLLLDDAREYAAAMHLQQVIDLLTPIRELGGDGPGPVPH